MKDAASPPSATITYAVISLILRMISTQCGVFNLWYQRRAYERSRGELITMLYEKTLNRKIKGTKQEVNDDHNGNANGHSNGESNGETEPLLPSAANDKSKSRGIFRKLWNNFCAIILRSKNNDTEKANDAASMGKILNLMRNDVYEIAQRFWEFSDIITKPTGAIFTTLLIWQMLGWSCLLGVLAMAATQAVNVVVARYQVYFEKKRRVATDEKLQRTTQFIESIRHLRWYGWQEAWLKDILESRQKELHLRIIQIIFYTSLSFVLRFGAGIFPTVAFYAFSVLARKPLGVDLIFPALC